MPRINDARQGIEISIFFGDHDPPYVHIYDAGQKAKVDIASGEIIEGRLSRSGYKKVTAWLDRNREFAMTKWDEFCR
ncbi:MAG: DUF4160 domain-containing protein [Rhodospirillales bacterium]|jgi:hypothetical protein|nr:hypothetical protein [Rhodospirillaceae bacterium]MDP6427004.1 DUF4160 domain-containing protein [Rhodospirillales bacterium]MDP6644634.1 DUF4160 domain-containing protein [Rhodospirillales bacterium]|tara:strand:- start:2360 stop:2590 length:231 start_codon:yes stop_codon:yes gene_type:complete